MDEPLFKAMKNLMLNTLNTEYTVHHSFFYVWLQNCRPVRVAKLTPAHHWKVTCPDYSGFFYIA